MRRNFSTGRLAWLLLAVFVVSFTAVQAQPVKHVTFTLPSLDYDVIYLGDFIDVTTQKLSNNIPNFTGTIQTDVPGYIVLEVHAYIKFRGESDQELAHVVTYPFFVNGTRPLTSSDLAVGSSDIKMKISTNVFDGNSALKKRIEDYAARFPTAPVADYTMQLIAYDSKGVNQIGQATKLITIRNASPEEVQVNLIDPQPGAVISTTLPTFSWNTPNSKVTLYVYEMLPIYQSPQEAITGIPYLKLDIDGPQTVTYPSDAARRLELNKTYVWFVEAAVTTNRQTVQRRSEVRLFRIRLNDQSSQEISDMMNGFGGSAAGTFATLQSIGWVPAGTMTIDGKPLTLDDLKALVARLLAQNVQVTVRVE
ncbi:MAG TPA: hypothetical protein VI758_06945 [Bacteroidota bacterium]